MTRTLHFGLRVNNLDRSVEFYKALGYEVVGQAPETELGHLVMLKLPQDEFVTIELVYDKTQPPVEAETRLSHMVVHVESMDAIVRQLDTHGIATGNPSSPDGSEDFFTSWVVDPDGNRIELVQWPSGHPEGMTADDFR